MSDELKGMLLGLLGCTVFAFTMPATRLVIAYLDPLFVGCGRAAAAALIAMLLLYYCRSPLPTMQQLKGLVVVTAGVGIGFPVLSAAAMQSLTSAHAGVMLGILPLATSAAAAVMGRERPSLGFWLSALAGGALVIGFALIDAGWQLRGADIVFLIAIVVAAFGYAVGGLLAQEMGGWRVICWALVLAFPIVSVPALLHAPSADAPPSFKIWFWFLYLALGSQLLGFFFWNAGLALGGIARVSQTQLLQPFITLVVSAALVGEPLYAYTWLFAVLVISTVAMGRKMPVLRVTRAQR